MAPTQPNGSDDEAPAPHAANPSAEDPSTWPRIPDVELEAMLGRGGQGFVFRGRQLYLDRKVAVKVLDAELRTPGFVSRFRREARMLAGLQHPHVVTCHHAGVTDDGLCFMVMKFVEGPDLGSWLHEHGALPLAAAIDLGIAMAQALEHAHAQGLIHRDVKPENVLLQPRTDTKPQDPFPFVPLLADLGLARPLVRTKGASLYTPMGAMVGTPATMAPEQFDDAENVDQRADIYGLGCVLHHAIAGMPAFTGRTMTELVQQKVAVRATVPRPLGREVPEALAKLLGRMLAPDPALRPANHGEVVRELQDLRATLAHAAPRRRALPVVAVALLAAGIAAAVFLGRQEPERKEPGTVPMEAPVAGAAALVAGAQLPLFGADESTTMGRWQCEDPARWQFAEGGDGVLVNTPRSATRATVALPGGSFAFTGTIEPRFRYLSPEQPRVPVASVQLELALGTQDRFALQLTPRAGTESGFDAVLQHVLQGADGMQASTTELLRTSGTYPEASPMRFALAWNGTRLQADLMGTAPPVDVGPVLAPALVDPAPRLTVAVDRGVAVLRNWTLTGR